MRPRVHNTGLQKSVYERSGAYYYVEKNKWHRLCDTSEDLDTAIAAFKKQMSRSAILEYCYRALVRSRANAKGRRGIPFSLERADISDLLDRCGYKCSITNTPFATDILGGKRPYAPSIDRVDSNLGYIKENCRIVCVAVNFALNTWGDDVLNRLFENWQKTKKY